MVQKKHKQKHNCPICGSERKKMLFQQRFSTISDVSIIDGYSVVVCKDCGFGFANNIPEQAVFDAYYREMSKYEYQHRGGQESEDDLARFQAISDIIKQFLHNTQARILEVGCATGRLLSLLKESGYCNVLGLDPAPVCAEVAQRLYGIRVLTSTLSDVSAVKRPFDFLILVGVIEHIRNLVPALAKIRNILSAEGLMFVEVPDITQFARWPDAPFQQFSTEHVNFFSATSLANLMQLSGFVQVFCQQDTRKQSHGTMMPVVSAIFRKGNPRSMSPVRDVETEQGLVEYICQSQQVDGHIRQTIDNIVVSDRPIIVWGVGTHTLRLLATSRLKEANICVFVDSNPKYQGKQLNGIPIIAPTNLKDRSEPILISSRVFQQDIKRQIQDELKCNNELILLYQV